MKKIYKLTDEQKAQMLSLYNEGKMDSEIATILGNVTRSAIYYWRKKMGLKSKFTYAKISKIDAQKCKELFEQGLSDYKIAKILGVSPDGVFSHRQRYSLIRNKKLAENDEIQLTQEQKEFLLGTLLGDSSLSIGKWCKNPRYACAHCVKQKEYAEYKAELFKSLNARCSYGKRNAPDKRNGIYYEEYRISAPANPAFMEFHKSFYINGKKHIAFDLFKYFSGRSLALWYMDDGYKVNNVSYALSTNCFEKDELLKMISFLKEKFDFNASIWNNNCIHIHKDSVQKFNALVLPYICKCMSYKIID